MLTSHTGANPLDDLEPVTDAAEVRKLIGIVGQVHVSADVQRYTVAITSATRRSDELTLGASPRASLHLLRAAKAVAARPWTAVTTCSPTTCSGSPGRCSPTGCCRASRRR